MPKLKIATCQFPVSPNLKRNSGYFQRQITAAAEQGAQVVHFPECALSGYPGNQFQTWENYPWNVLNSETEDIMELARYHSVWVLVGSSHPLTGKNLPHNCVYVINPEGKIVERYDKLFSTPNDLKFYTPGNHFSVFEIEGIKCGILICHDVRYPELYREYKKRGVQCMFQSFNNALAPGPSIHGIIMKPTLQAHAACNYMWISVANAAEYYQSWSSCFILPDGKITQSLRIHRGGIMVNEVDADAIIRDKCSFRDRAMSGILHSGEVIEDDPRSNDRSCL